MMECPLSRKDETIPVGKKIVIAFVHFILTWRSSKYLNIVVHPREKVVFMAYSLYYNPPFKFSVTEQVTDVHKRLPVLAAFVIPFSSALKI